MNTLVECVFIFTNDGWATLASEPKMGTGPIGVPLHPVKEFDPFE